MFVHIVIPYLDKDGSLSPTPEPRCERSVLPQIARQVLRSLRDAERFNSPDVALETLRGVIEIYGALRLQPVRPPSTDNRARNPR